MIILLVGASSSANHSLQAPPGLALHERPGFHERSGHYAVVDVKEEVTVQLDPLSEMS